MKLDGVLHPVFSTPDLLGGLTYGSHHLFIDLSGPILSEHCPPGQNMAFFGNLGGHLQTSA